MFPSLFARMSTSLIARTLWLCYETTHFGLEVCSDIVFPCFSCCRVVWKQPMRCVRRICTIGLRFLWSVASVHLIVLLWWSFSELKVYSKLRFSMFPSYLRYVDVQNRLTLGLPIFFYPTVYRGVGNGTTKHLQPRKGRKTLNLLNFTTIYPH